jgi:hypothetical protein
MASIIGVNELQHTNGTTAATITSGGVFTITNPAPAAAGSVLQIQKSASLDSGYHSSTSGTYTEIATANRVTITPISANSYMLVQYLYGWVVGGSTRMGIVMRVGTNSDFSGMANINSLNHTETHRNNQSAQLYGRANRSDIYDAYSSTATLYFSPFFNRGAGSGNAGIGDNRGVSFVTVTEIAQ